MLVTTACACTPYGFVGGAMVTVGKLVYAVPPLVMLMLVIVLAALEIDATTVA